MLHIDTLGDVLLIQIPRTDRRSVIEVLEKLRAISRVDLPSDTRTRVSFIRTANEREFIVNISEELVEVRLPQEQIDDLVASIEEHIAEESEYELDHALEPLGASILPRSFKDVVIETREG